MQKHMHAYRNTLKQDMELCHTVIEKLAACNEPASVRQVPSQYICES
jgi:hypothetical protein